jgi:NADP-dependent 3-hydroxy acid dehydrogenase YdfG
MRVLITGANRGLGNAITKQLLHAYTPLTLHVTARDLNGFDLSMYAATTSTISYHQLHLDDENPANISAFTRSLPSFNQIFHIASPYNKTNLQQATAADLNTITTCQRNELMLLTQLSRKLIDGGSLVAAGSIVGVVTDPATSLPNHPWYAGLFSLYKANLRSIMACLYQEMPNHRIIHANLGAFLDESEANNESLKSGNALTTQLVAKTMIELATSKSETKDFNVDIMSHLELQTLYPVMACN